MADSNIAGLPAGAAITDTDLIAGSDAGSGTLVKKTGLQFNAYIRNMLSSLPTTDPHVAGVLWNNGGLVSISQPFTRSLAGNTGMYALTGGNASVGSAAGVMLAPFAQGLAIDFVNNSAMVKDTGTPANNFDGVPSSLLTTNGTPTTGPNGGKLVDLSNNFSLVIGKFPFSSSVGTLAIELVRSDLSTFGQYYAIGSSLFDEHLAIRSGATPAIGRFEVNGSPEDAVGLIVNLPAVVAGTFGSGNIACSTNGSVPVKGSATPDNSAATALFLFGFLGSGTLEILRAWYIPQYVDDPTLASFQPAIKQTFHIDSVSGNDSNNGLTSGAAKATFSSTLAAPIRGGDIIAIKGGTTSRENVFNIPASSTLTSYGTGKGRLSGSRIISSGSWVADGTYVNVSKSVVSQTVNPASLFYPMVWDDDVQLAIYLGGGTIANNRAYVDATPGTFTVHQTGSTVANPRADSNGTSYTYYVHLADGSNPASSVMEYAEQINIITLQGGETFSNVIIQRTSAKDMINKDFGNVPFYTNNADLLEAAVHAIVGSPAHHTNSTATALPSSINDSAGGGFHFFRDQVSEGTAALCTAVNCTATGFGQGFYSHGTGAGDEQVEVDLTDCSSIRCNIGIQSGVTTNGWHITHHTHTSCTIPDELQPNDVVIP